MFYLPLAFFGVPTSIMATHLVLGSIYNGFIHQHAVPKLGKVIPGLGHLVEFIFVTPSHHRVHHGKGFWKFWKVLEKKVCRSKKYRSVDLKKKHVCKSEKNKKQVCRSKQNTKNRFVILKKRLQVWKKKVFQQKGPNCYCVNFNTFWKMKKYEIACYCK